MQKMMEEKLHQAKEEMETKAQKAQEISEKETVKIKELEELNIKLQEQIEVEKKKAGKVVENKVEKPKTPPPSNDAVLKTEISRLKKEIERIHKTWEKKFAILQQSLHALKDESYLRQTLQRQAANLHQAAVSYAVDSPAGIVPAKIPSANPKKPLPDIGKHVKGYGGSHGDKNVDKDCLSYTVSAPSGRGTTILSVDENQVMSDDNDQDFPVDVKLLPQPPIRNQSESEVLEDGRPTSVSHVVVLPSAQL
ncbi:hypothetical protein LOTGIDRAFT_238311 [Lottia gigantea]|uniref:Uncharacterized protein n=1 Tax=Lottia gigantea TaxID=225164 RepID=V4B5B7_LOTGI|nr:hypothetical protein LOTGIDRAFT_238311 [Lottia gigantea]ESP01192.1 hypothetical protein LOTGIDRAFT_238311 [Lottia gigantea]